MLAKRSAFPYARISHFAPVPHFLPMATRKLQIDAFMPCFFVEWGFVGYALTKSNGTSKIEPGRKGTVPHLPLVHTDSGYVLQVVQVDLAVRACQNRE
jgi:hypothetical protein